MHTKPPPLASSNTTAQQQQQQYDKDGLHCIICSCFCTHEATKAAWCLQVISIDHTPGTTMCVIGLGSAVARQWGAQEGARTALPVMTPCLAVADLTPQQYTTAMR